MGEFVCLLERERAMMASRNLLSHRLAESSKS